MAANSLAHAGRLRDKLLGLLLVACAVAWGMGVTLPLMTVEKVMVFEDAYAVSTLLATLYDDREWLLLGLIGLFAVASPVLKLLDLFFVWWRYDLHGRRIEGAFKRIDLVSKWSMGDVFVVAVVVVIFKTSGFLADAHTGPGLYWFTGSALGSMIAALLLKRAVRKNRGE